jgi:hypothetical protein
MEEFLPEWKKSEQATTKKKKKKHLLGDIVLGLINWHTMITLGWGEIKNITCLMKIIINMKM